MSKKEESKEIAGASLYQQDADDGHMDISKEDLLVPRIGIIQALSPQVDKSKSQYLEDASAGQIHNNVSNKLWDGDEGMLVIPVAYRRTYLEWAPRSEGGGLVNDHGDDPNAMKKTDENGINEDGNKISLTGEYFVVLVDKETGEFEPASLSMSRTQIRASKKWNTMINSFRMKGEDGKTFAPPFYARIYRMKTAHQSNEQGSWYGWSVAPEGTLIETLGEEIGGEIYASCKDFRQSYMDGKVKSSESETETEESDSVI